MCTLDLKFDRLKKRSVLMVCCTLVLLCASRETYAQKASSGERFELSSQNSATDDKKFRYKNMIRDERRLLDRSRYVEKIVSGFAALGIGVYGYYFDRQNIGRQLAYSATQTAGVFMISNSLLEGEAPSLLLEADKKLRREGEISYGDYQKIVVEVDRQKKKAAYKQVAYSAGILAGLYSVNSYQERNRNLALRNVYGFLSLNFAVISGVSFWQLNNVSERSSAHMTFGFLPEMYIAFHF